MLMCQHDIMVRGSVLKRSQVSLPAAWVPVDFPFFLSSNTYQVYSCLNTASEQIFLFSFILFLPCRHWPHTYLATYYRYFMKLLQCTCIFLLLPKFLENRHLRYTNSCESTDFPVQKMHTTELTLRVLKMRRE